MQSDTSQRAAVKRVTLRLSRLLYQLLLEVNIGVGDFIAIAKLAAVQAVRAADREAKRPPPSISRIAVKTGLSRPEVRKLLQVREHPPAAPRRRMRARGDRVLAGWRSDPTFLDEFNKPAILNLHGPEPSFATLVKTHSGTERVAPILDELLATQAVRQTDDGRLQLLKDTCVNVHWDDESIETLGNDLLRLFEASLHNLRRPNEPPKFARSYESDSVDPAHLPFLMRQLTDRAKLFFDTGDELLSRNKYAPKEGDEKAPRRVAIAIQIVDEPVTHSMSTKRHVKRGHTTSKKPRGEVGAR
jgi:hypothetical protein